MILLNDLNQQYLALKKELDRAVLGVMKTSHFIMGKELGAFENEYAAFCQRKFALGTGSGTSALLFALLALGIGRGDEVIVPANTFCATCHAVLLAGAVPVPGEVKEDTFNLDPDKLESALSPRTKAIIPVHLYGLPAEMEPIVQFARRRKLFVIEDASQAHGAVYQGKPAGSFGDVSCFSFYPSKNLGGIGDGGMALTDSQTLAEKIFELRCYGGQIHNLPGYNCRLDEIQAAVLRVKLKYLPQWNRMRRQAAERYREALSGTGLTLPREFPDAPSVYHLFVIRHKKRWKLREHLLKREIYAQIHYQTPFHKVSPYRQLYSVAPHLPVAEQLCREILSLPIHPYITGRQIEEVAREVKTALNENA